MNTASDWLFNLMLWGAILALVVLCLNAFVAPILGPVVAIIGLILVVVVAALWPQW